MLIHSYVNGGYGFKGIDNSGGEVRLPLKLLPVYSGEMDAVSAKYVDTAVLSFDASKVTGVFPKERLPGFTGSDVAGSIDNLTLTETGVTANEYGVVNVNSKGRVVGARALTDDDIPSFNWSKVVSRPSTLSGYGITDALTGTGGVLTGDLKVNLTATLNNHVINKESFDSLVDVIDQSLA